MNRFRYGLLAATMGVVFLISFSHLGRDETAHAMENSQEENNNMKFGYTLCYVSDVEKTLAFYEAAFGFTRKFYNKNGQEEYGELETGPTTLGFVSHALAASTLKASPGVTFAPSQANGPAPAVDLGFVTDDVTAAYQKAVKGGAIAVLPPEDKPWGQKVGYVRDLNGFLVSICSEIAK